MSAQQKTKDGSKGFYLRLLSSGDIEYKAFGGISGIEVLGLLEFYKDNLLKTFKVKEVKEEKP